MRVNLGHIGNNINNHMLNWYIHTYGEVPDLSQQVTFILAQILAACMGMFALMIICYGIVKLLTREK